MLYRVFVAAVALFWVAMMAVYLRATLAPATSPAWLQIPPQHVLDLIFQQEETSPLEIYLQGRPQGNVAIIPRKLEDGTRQIGCRGEVFYRPPGAPKSLRVLFQANADLNRQSGIQSFDIRISLRSPAIVITAQIDPEKRTYKYSTEVPGENPVRSEGSLETLLNNPALPFLAAPGLPVQSLFSKTPSGRFSASTDSLTMRRERISTYRVDASFGEQLSFQIHLTQTGRILLITSPIQLTLAAEGIDIKPSLSAP